MSSVEMNPIPQSFDQVYRQLNKTKDRQLVEKGWDYLTQGMHPCTKFAVGVATRISVLGMGALSSLAAYFGTCAYQDARQAEKHGEDPSIGGHTSEWWVLAGTITFSYWRARNEVSSIGKFIFATALFDEAIQKSDSSERNRIYEEKLSYVRNYPDTLFVYLPRLPKAPKLDDEQEIAQVDTLRLDIELDKVYRKIEQKMQSCSFGSCLQEGWHQMGLPENGYPSKTLKAALAAEGIFLGVHIVNYPYSIYLAAEQALKDDEEGIRPTIGGHCVEWAAELGVLCGVGYLSLNEIATFGYGKKIMDIFDQEIDNMGQEKALRWEEKCQRLDQEKRIQIQLLKDGFILRRDQWLQTQEQDPSS